MPSIFKKILYTSTPGSKPNPYTNPNHPNHPNTPFTTPAPSQSSSSPFRSTPPPPRRPNSPSEFPHDLLAEARRAVGRNPITGKLLPAESSGGGARGEAGPAPTGGRVGKSVYTETSEGRSRTSGTRYDLFVREMRGRKEGAWTPPAEGFYAPPGRRVEEFYAPPTGGFYAPGRR